MKIGEVRNFLYWKGGEGNDNSGGGEDHLLVVEEEKNGEEGGGIRPHIPIPQYFDEQEVEEEEKEEEEFKRPVMVDASTQAKH